MSTTVSETAAALARIGTAADPPVLVGGLPRSGTTLMAKLLGSHPELAIPPTELSFFPLVIERRASVSGRPDFERQLRLLLTHPRGAEEWGLDEQALLAAAREVQPDERTLFVLFLELYRRRTGKPRLGEKSPNNERWLEYFDSWFSEYRFVQLVRDPIDAYASLKWFRPDPGDAPASSKPLLPWIHQWNDSAAVALRRSSRDFRRYVFVRYEDLVAEPAGVMSRVCSVVGVEPDVERMLAMEGYETAENSSFADLPARRDYESRIRRSDDVDRRSRLTDQELGAIRSMCGPLASLLGYDVGPLRRRPGHFGRLLPGRVPFRTGAAYLARRALRRAR